MIVAMGSDHAGFPQKQLLADYLRGRGHEVHDCGTFSEERCDYPDFAVKVAAEVASGEAERGILVCGTGIGMAMAAGKVAGIRAANITTPQFATLCREHNDANVITLSGRFVDLEVNEEICDAFMSTDFAGGRHAGRVAKIDALDR